jgi:beta-phosphoglucomutase
MTIRAVVFDMDGVLIDAREWHYEALNRALAHVGFGISRIAHLESYDGLPTRRKLEMLSIERGLPRGLHAFLNELKQVYTIELIEARCRPVFQHEYALARLRNDGYLLGLASNSVRQSVERMMSKSGLLPFLDVVLSNDDVPVAKPDPAIYRAAMERLGVEPHEVLVVEDNHHGIESARAAGAHILVVTTPQDLTYELVANRIAQLETAEAPAG